MRHNNIRNTLLIATVTLVCGFSANAASALSCPVESAPSTTVAENLYKSAANKLSPLLLKRFPIVKASDRGDHWAMSQTYNAPPAEDVQDHGYYVASSLKMNIDKCTGKVSHAGKVKTRIAQSAMVFGPSDNPKLIRE